MPKFVEFHWRGESMSFNVDTLHAFGGKDKGAWLSYGNDECTYHVEESYEEVKAKLEVQA